MKFYKITTIGLSLLLSVRSLANLPEDPTEYARWESGLLGSIRAQEGLPPESSIPKLGRWVMQMALPNNLEKGDRPVFHAAQTALLAIPGHATYYGDRINKAQAERKAVLGTDNEYSMKTAEFRDVRTEGFETLRNLPSAETVGVLGEYLSDEWASPIPVQDKMMESSLARHSVEKLAVMTLVKKPTALTEDPSNPGVPIPDLKAWQQWYEQIKAGKRTFQFEGDPTEYTLAGPATQETLQRIERDRKRDEERLARHRKSSPASDFVSRALNLSKPSSIAGILTALTLCAAAVWYFLKGRKVA